MGISSNHCKVVPEHKAPNLDHYFYLDDLMEQSPEFVKQNEHLIATMKYPKKVFLILFFKDEKLLQHFLSENSVYEDHVLLIGEPSELESEIKAIEAERQLDGGTCYDQVNSTYIRRIYPLEYHSELVMYYALVGWMKYGMGGTFYQDFEQLKYYFKKTDILKAATYVDNDLSDVDNVAMFQRDFVDSFEEGKSLFYHF